MCRRLPRTGHTVKTPDGQGEVADTNALTGKVKVKMPLEDGTFEYVSYDYSEIRVKDAGPRKGKKKEGKDPGANEEIKSPEGK